MSNDRHVLENCEGTQIMNRSDTKLLYVSTAKYGGDWASMMHSHGFTELFFVVGGAGQFKFSDCFIPVTANDLVIINPNVEHTEYSVNAGPFEYIVLGVSGLEFQMSDREDGRFSVVNLAVHQEETLFYLRTMLREIGTKMAGYEAVCQNMLEMLLINLLRQTKGSFEVSSAVGSRTSKECAMVKRYIDHHFKEAITLDLLAEISHLNKFYMVHAFGREYGISPINYLLDCRITESCHLLSGTDHPLADIAGILGFSSPSYFSQSFRRRKGMSPMEYRKISRGKTVSEHGAEQLL